MNTVEYISASVEETEAIAARLALEAAAKGKAFLALFGDMGVGKTAFVRGFCQALAIGGVHSPTYALVNEYRGEGRTVYHFDLYRLSDEDDLYAIDFDHYVEQNALILCEWSERLGSLLPPDAWRITIARTEKEGIRTISVCKENNRENSGT
ncbi:MAG: tRNA (adenosine(37)-N6)-threonylcarbamoyltransferase complex ATPase subunit type 1 TsaE [Clostridia bacterium]|nr:tRNA (adenosine(37)-N6)-threonylcarbamoyltransferase complex ATPase subunit type 1 TsaE [Clostridia bacterium]